MMETKFTKGNWINITSNDSIVANGNLIASTAQPFYPSECLENGESWLSMRERTKPERILAKNEQKANAKLISAAPDLLKSLDDLIEICRIIPKEVFTESGLNVFKSALNNANKAIEKATE